MQQLIRFRQRIARFVCGSRVSCRIHDNEEVGRFSKEFLKKAKRSAIFKGQLIFVSWVDRRKTRWCRWSRTVWCLISSRVIRMSDVMGVAVLKLITSLFLPTRCPVCGHFITFYCTLAHKLCNFIRYDTIRDAVLTCARKPTWVSLIYRTGTTTKRCKTEKLKSKNGVQKSSSERVFENRLRFERITATSLPCSFLVHPVRTGWRDSGEHDVIAEGGLVVSHGGRRRRRRWSRSAATGAARTAGTCQLVDRRPQQVRRPATTRTAILSVQSCK